MPYRLSIHNGEREFFIVKDKTGELYATIVASDEERALEIPGDPVADVYRLSAKIVDKIHAAIGDQMTEENYTVKLHAVQGFFSTLLATCTCSPNKETTGRA